MLGESPSRRGQCSEHRERVVVERRIFVMPLRAFGDQHASERCEIEDCEV